MALLAERVGEEGNGPVRSDALEVLVAQVGQLDRADVEDALQAVLADADADDAIEPHVQLTATEWEPHCPLGERLGFQVEQCSGLGAIEALHQVPECPEDDQALEHQQHTSATEPELVFGAGELAVTQGAPEAELFADLGREAGDGCLETAPGPEGGDDRRDEPEEVDDDRVRCALHGRAEADLGLCGHLLPPGG